MPDAAPRGADPSGLTGLSGEGRAGQGGADEGRTGEDRAGEGGADKGRAGDDGAGEGRAGDDGAPRVAIWRTVRFRLLLIALLPMLVVMPLLLATTGLGWVKRFDDLTIAKVNSDLTIAHQHLETLLESRRAAVAALGASAALAAQDPQDPGFADFLRERQQALSFDFLYHLDPAGRVTGAPALPALLGFPVVAAAAAGQDGAAIDVLDAELLEAIDPDLAARARIPLVPTEAAVPTDRTVETRGMVVHVATPAVGGGVLVGGLLLNRNLAFIDSINDLVYPGRNVALDGAGTVTLFLDDVRIGTNVRLFENVRALGTRVSASVRAAVLDRGRVWLDRAFVVNDWYVSAYEPIVDSYGNRVGMLYVGFLDAPFEAAKRRTLYTLLASVALTILVVTPILLAWARGIFSPLERMNAAIGRVEGGDLGARSGVAARPGEGDEIAHVAGHLDLLLDRIEERDARLRGWADELEVRVAARTRDLEEAHRELEITTRQLIHSEKQAAIGEITASVAHEINNPLAVIQGNLDVIEHDLGPRAAPLRTEFALIQQQVQSVLVLVSKVLQFARPDDFAETTDVHDPDRVLRDTVPLIQHLLSRGDVALEFDLQAGRLVAMSRGEFQQVALNLMINAVQSIEGKGRLTIGTRAAARDGVAGVAVRIEDTGRGMPPAVMARIFDPFFTTKRGRGTGLGLSISRKLIDRAGGTIGVASTEGAGTRFDIWLPAAPGSEGQGPDAPGSGVRDPVSPDPVSPGPGAPDPGSSGPGSPDPGASDPGAPDLGAPDPGAPGPGASGPAAPDRGTGPDGGAPDPGSASSGRGTSSSGRS